RHQPQDHCNAPPIPYLRSSPTAIARSYRSFREDAIDRRAMPRLKVGVLIYAARGPGYPAEIALVLSNNPAAAGLVRAAKAGIPHRAIPHPDRAGFAA